MVSKSLVRGNGLCVGILVNLAIVVLSVTTEGVELRHLDGLLNDGNVDVGHWIGAGNPAGGGDRYAFAGD